MEFFKVRLVTVFVTVHYLTEKCILDEVSTNPCLIFSPFSHSGPCPPCRQSLEFVLDPFRSYLLIYSYLVAVQRSQQQRENYSLSKETHGKVHQAAKYGKICSFPSWADMHLFATVIKGIKAATFLIQKLVGVTTELRTQELEAL